jgi:TonB family protein
MFSALLVAAIQVAQVNPTINLSQTPRLRNPQAIVTFRDYPSDSLRQHEYGIVSIVLRVSPEGRVISCDITESSGAAALDKKTCSLHMARARFDPAKDATGLPTAGEYRASTSWGIEEHQPRTTIDTPLQVSTVPKGYRSPVKARLIFDATGHVMDCEVTATSGSGAADRAACTYIGQQLVITAPKSSSGDVPPAAVRYLTASFTTQSVKPAARR